MATTRLRLNHSKEKNGELKKTPCSILIDLSTNRGRIELSTGEKVIPKHWNKDRQEVRATMAGHTEINLHLAKLKQEILQVWRENHSLGVDNLRGLVRAAIRGGQSDQKKTLIEAVQLFIAQYAKEKNSSTLPKYKALLKRLTEFSHQYDFDFKTLDFNFYDAFKNYLHAIPNPNYTNCRLVRNSYSGCLNLVPNLDDGSNNGLRVGLFDEVVYKYFTNLKTVCAWAEKRGHEVNQSYKSFEIIKREYAPISLTLGELRKLEETHLTGNIAVARDYLSLECRTGQRISDLSRFSASDIEGNLWTFTQKKGNRLNSKRIVLPLVGYCAPALLILQKYNYQLPKISEQNLNYNIKEACKLAGIDQEMYIERWAGNKKIRIPGRKYEFISTHTGRKTFITITLQFLSPKLVMDLTGIRSFKTLKHYNGDSEIGTIENALRGIEDNISLMRKAQ